MPICNRCVLIVVLGALSACASIPRQETLNYGCFSSIEIEEIRVPREHLGEYRKFISEKWSKKQQFDKVRGFIVDAAAYLDAGATSGAANVHLLIFRNRNPNPQERAHQRQEFLNWQRITEEQTISGSAERDAIRKFLGAKTLVRLDDTPNGTCGISQ